MAQMPSLANSEDTDEMLHNAALYLGLHYLLRQKDFKRNTAFYLEIIKSVTSQEHTGSVVECLTQDQGAAGSSLTGVTVFCP